MNKSDKIFVAGHNGMVGSAILRKLKEHNYKNIIYEERKYLDLCDQAQVNNFFLKNKPDIVIIAAAKVGGIISNINFPADFIYNNLMVQSNIIQASYTHNVKKLLFLGSSCIYPRSCMQPIKENFLLTGELEKTNEAYAVAKIAGIKMCESYLKQFNCDFRSIMPTNLYGLNDNYHPDYSHVIPGLIHRFHLSKELGFKEINIWGTGNVKREFMYVDDLADASLFLLSLDRKKYYAFLPKNIFHVNVGSGEEIKIRDLAKLIADITDYKGDMIFDDSMPDGTERKLMDSSLLNKMGWYPKISLEKGLKISYEDYLSKIN